MSSLNLSEAENKILACAWQCFKTGFPEVSEVSSSLVKFTQTTTSCTWFTSQTRRFLCVLATIKSPTAGSPAPPRAYCFTSPLHIYDAMLSCPSQTTLPMSSLNTPTSLAVHHTSHKANNSLSQIDYEKLSRMVGHSNSRSTSNAMANIRKKLARAAEATGTPLTPSGSRAASPSKKGSAKKTPSKATKAKQNEEDGAGEPATPTAKRTPRSTAGKRKYKEDTPVSSEDEDRERTVGAVDGGAEVAVKREDDDEQEDGGIQEPKTPEMNTGVKVKGKKEGVKSPAKSPAKPRQTQTVTSGVRAAKKLKMEMEAEEAGDGEGEGAVESVED